MRRLALRSPQVRCTLPLRHGFDGVEVYNEVVRWLNGKSCGTFHWDCMLAGNWDTLGFACDDAHITDAHPVWNGGWIVVSAPELSREHIVNAIRCGNYYSSCGPRIHTISTTEHSLSVTTSPVKEIRLVGPRARGARG